MDRGDYPEPGEGDTAIPAELAALVTALRAVETFGLAPEGSLHSYRAEPILRRDAITRRSMEASAGLIDGRGRLADRHSTMSHCRVPCGSIYRG